MSFRYFYDLPVYRLPRDKYYSERDKYIDKILFPPDGPVTQELRRRDEENPKANDAIRDHMARSYGGCWEFNEIIGYIRLHFLGTQVRGEYFAVSKQRIVRTRTKTIEFQTWKLAPEVDIKPPYENQQILAAIREYIEDCKSELPRRAIETALFEVLAPHIEWASLLR